MSTNGSRPEENQFILDGLTNDNPLQGLTIINGPGRGRRCGHAHAARRHPGSEDRGKSQGRIRRKARRRRQCRNQVRNQQHSRNGVRVRPRHRASTRTISSTLPASPSGRLDWSNMAPRWRARSRKTNCSFFMGYEAESYSVGNLFFAPVPEDISQVSRNRLAATTANSLVDALSDAGEWRSDGRKSANP